MSDLRKLVGICTYDDCSNDAEEECFTCGDRLCSDHLYYTYEDELRGRGYASKCFQCLIDTRRCSPCGVELGEMTISKNGEVISTGRLICMNPKCRLVYHPATSKEVSNIVSTGQFTRLTSL